MADEKKTEKKPAAKPAGKPDAAKGGGEKKRTKPGSGITYEVAPEGAQLANKFPKLREHYEKNVVPALMKKLNLKNPMQVPYLKYIVVNACSKDAVANPKVLDSMVAEIATITGQKPVLTRARLAISAFKLRKGLPIGAMVTLRNKRMYEFMDRLVNVSLPRVRDFRGVSSKSFDGRGNYCLGLKEQVIFSEIVYDQVDKTRGMNISFVTSAKDNESARMLLAEMGMPFKK
jgi:large subunit ribosomal protein L5